MIKQLKIIVAVHKPYDVLNDNFYLPVHAGAAQGKDIGYQSDAQGEAISEKNPFYCELTVLYWAWKNLQADALEVLKIKWDMIIAFPPCTYLTAAGAVRLFDKNGQIKDSERFARGG